MTHLAQDLRFALRALRKSPVFTAVAIVSLALGIGANTAIFSLVDQLLLRLLPVRDPKSLVLLTGKGRHYGSNNGINALSYPMYQDIRNRNSVFSGMMAKYTFTPGVAVGTDVEAVGGELVSGNYFPVLGIPPALGRLFTSKDDLVAGTHPVAVLSYAWWQSRFGGDPHVLGRVVRVNSYPLTIVGVAQKGFGGMEPGVPASIFIPMAMAQQVRPGFTDMYDRRSRWINVYGRLLPGMTREQAQAGLQPLFHQIIAHEVTQPAFRNATPYARQQFLQMWMQAIPGSQGNTFLRRKFEKPLLVLTAVVGLVLLIACANLASLLTARAAARRKEIAIRLALGASRGRLIGQLLTESMLLALAGAATGVLLSIVMVKALISLLPYTLTGYSLAATPDGTLLAFSLGLSVVTGIAFGLAPALQATRSDVAPVLKNETGGAGGHIAFRKVLVAAQVALSLILLIGAGLFARSLGNLHDINSGYQVANRLQFVVNPRTDGYDQARSVLFYRQLLDRLKATPGIRSAAISDMAMLNGNEWDQWVTIDSYHHGPGEVPDPHFNAVSPGYFRTLGVRLISGRDFNDRDDRKSPRVVIVNESFARKYLAGQPAVGHRIGLGGDPTTVADTEIVGVVSDARYEGLRDPIPEEVYLCRNQRDLYSGVIYIDSERDPAAAFAAVHSAMHEVGPTLAIVGLKTMSRQVDESLVTDRMISILSVVFGGLATGLALIGLYGVMSFTITRRSREIGIRMALGALRGNVIGMVMREVFLLILAGTAVGLPLAYLLTRLVRAQLYGIEPGDPGSIAIATVLLIAVTAAAGLIPARRAASFDPLRVLRYE